MHTAACKPSVLQTWTVSSDAVVSLQGSEMGRQWHIQGMRLSCTQGIGSISAHRVWPPLVNTWQVTLETWSCHMGWYTVNCAAQLHTKQHTQQTMVEKALWQFQSEPSMHLASASVCKTCCCNMPSIAVSLLLQLYFNFADFKSSTPYGIAWKPNPDDLPEYEPLPGLSPTRSKPGCCTYKASCAVNYHVCILVIAKPLSYCWWNTSKLVHCMFWATLFI